MKLKKCLGITKTANFSVFVKKSGCNTSESFDITRNEKGELPKDINYLNFKVVEIIPHSSGVNIVIESKY